MDFPQFDYDSHILILIKFRIYDNSKGYSNDLRCYISSLDSSMKLKLLINVELKMTFKTFHNMNSKIHDLLKRQHKDKRLFLLSGIL